MKKRIIFTIATLVALGILGVAGYFLFLKKDLEETTYERLANNPLAAEAYKTAITDTDGDGLMDWEESLWKTDPKNADTDKDTYKDGEEVRLGYDPLDLLSNPATGKKAASSPLSETAYPKEELQNLNLTRNLATSMSSYVKDPSGLANASEDNPFTLLDEKTGLSLLNFVNELRPTIDTGEIKTTNDNSYQATMQYAEELKKAIPENPYPDEAEDDILSEAIQTENFGKIDEYVSYFETSISNMKKIIVPTDFSQNHKREIELLMATKKVYESVKDSPNDPLKAVLALQENQKIRKDMSAAMGQFLKLVQEHAE